MLHIINPHAHMPQNESQHVPQSGQVISPHFSSGRQSSLIHPFPGGVQIPQLSLQHSCPSGHHSGPHLGRDGLGLGGSVSRGFSSSFGRQRSLMHPFPGGMQIPHEGLQQVSPKGQRYILAKIWDSGPGFGPLGHCQDGRRPRGSKQ